MGRILIIDDEIPLRRMMAETLRRKGYETVEASDTEEGFRSTIEHKPDLIISDVCMQGGDGLALLARIRGDGRTSAIPFIVVTGHPDMEGMLTGAMLAADGYLPKPFRLETLLGAVKSRLNREHAIRQIAEERREQFQRILEASPDLIGTMDPGSHRFSFLNRAGRQMLGIPEDSEISEVHIGDLQLQDVADRIASEAIPAALDSGIWAGENILVTRDGRGVPVKQFVQAHRDHQGEVSFLSTIAHDLTDTKAAEAALRASEARFRALVDSLPDAVLMHDRHGKILFGNARTEELFGYSQAEISGAPIGSLVASFPSHPAESGPIAPFETFCRSRSGAEIPVDVVVSELEIAGEQSFLDIVRDLSDRKKLERERQVMELQLRQAQKLESIGQLAAGIAHEINTPAQYIGDNTRFLQDAFASLSKLLPEYEKLLAAARDGQVAPELVQRIDKARTEADTDYLMSEIPLAIRQSLDGADRVSKIVRAMKDFSHPGVTEKTLADLNHLIESTVTVARNEWKYVAELETDLDPELPLVPCLPGEFNQVILNLVINAAHAIADVVGEGDKGKGKIVISTRRVDAQHVETRVTDTGAGIPAHVRPRIFEPFFTTKEVGRGTGQGLAISRSVIVDKHGGSLSFETEMGVGTSFIVRLPLGKP